VPDFPSDEAIPLDGTVGRLDDLEAPPPFSSPEQSPLRVFVSGEATAHPGVMGLAEDIGLLIQEFLDARESGAEQGAPPESEPRGDVGIALHGLNLDRDEEAHLHRLIHKLIEERLERKEAAE
jgi:hypothetical protein